MACKLANSSFLFLGHQQKPIKSQRFSHLSSPGAVYLKLENLSHRREKQNRCSVSLRKSTIVKAVAVPVAPPAADSKELRDRLCESYGFRQIGEPLPDNITLKDIIDTLPKKVFEIDDAKAWKSVLVSVTSCTLGLFMIAKAPWYLLPLAWAWTGTAVTGFFVIGHDCAHKSFSRNKLVEDIVGTLAFLPLIYPYEPWRYKHDRHHAKTNMLNEDTAWHPIRPEEFESNQFLRKAIVYGYGPIRPWMSIAHWIIWHFDLKKFRPNEVNRVKISLACVFGFMAIGWPLIIFKTGIMGWIRFWLMPWLGYHFWMSTFTMVHHTAPHIPFKSSDKWNAAQAQLNGTVHCDYPTWIEILCHDINVHIPHHISPRIPSYNLRAAHKSLQENWGKYMNEATWNWRLMKTILTTCHVYNQERNYIAFDDIAPEISQPIALNEDTAWHPIRPEEFESNQFLRKAIVYGYGPIRPWMSIAHWIIWHFDLKKFRPNEVNRVKISLACVFGFMAIGWPLIIFKTGIMGWIKFWLMPWLGYHFWMSTFTMVHHTAPHIPFKSSDKWNAAQAQLNGTVHCDYPTWIEILCHDINVHIPHHISPRIPSYNLRAAHKSLQENWGKYMNEATWNWRLMKTILTTCHVYNQERNYIAFDDIAPEISQPIAFLKKVMPDYA